MSRLEHFDDEARRVVELAEDEAQLLGHVELGDDHLLLGVARVAPELIGVPIAALRARVAVGRGGLPRASPGTRPHLGRSARQAISIASRERGGKPVAPVDLLAAVSRGDGLAADALARIGVDSMADAPIYDEEE